MLKAVVERYDASEKAAWSQRTPGFAYGVNIPRGGKHVIAAVADGTIRWHSLADDRELLALFVHAKDRRWVAWTPKGYYLASPGAETLIGWHVNRGWNEAAQFFSVDRFREAFSRPRGATPEGLLDLAGSLLEWTSTLDRPYPYRADDGREDLTKPGERIVRGGNYVFDDAPERLTTWNRTVSWRNPATGRRQIGFRCAASERVTKNRWWLRLASPLTCFQSCCQGGFYSAMRSSLPILLTVMARPLSVSITPAARRRVIWRQTVSMRRPRYSAIFVRDRGGSKCKACG